MYSFDIFGGHHWVTFLRCFRQETA